MLSFRLDAFNGTQSSVEISEIRTGTIRVIKPRCEGKFANIVGTNEPDRLKGTSGADVIPALGGNDVIDRRGGNGRCLFWTNHSVNTRHKISHSIRADCWPGCS